MNQTYFGFFLQQMLGQSPLLLVYLLGIVLCAVWWRRAPQAAILALAGCAILLLSSIGFAFIQQQLIQNFNRGGATAQSYGQAMMWIGIGNSIIRAFAIGLLLFAVFAGRPRPAYEVRGGFEVPPPMPPMPR